MCKYCDEGESIYFDEKTNFVREIIIEDDKTLSIFTNWLGEDLTMYADLNIEINYCPMCGAKIGK